MSNYLTGDFLAAWADACLEGLRHHRDEINRLNVFPIPDSDTGTNMTATMECAVDQARHAAEQGRTGAADIAAALAAGAVAGARGNSGMVLSQIFRAIADTTSMSATGDLSARAVPVMLDRAGELVTHALSDPVEGTIVTVLREAARGAHRAVDSDREVTLAEVVLASRDAALGALERTTAQLDVLTDAGVVDAGGRGLVVILQALVDALGRDGDGAGPDRAQVPRGPEVPDSHGAGPDPHLELVFGFHGDAGALRQTLERLGDSVVVVGDGNGGHRAHVHTTAAGRLIEEIFRLGPVDGLRIEVLPVVRPSAVPTAVHPVIALLPQQGDTRGLADLFRAAGAAVSDGPDSLAAALGEVDGSGIVLTNGLDTSGLFDTLDRHGVEVTVVDTGSFVGGLAALAVYSQGADPDDNAEDMADAVHGQRWVDVPSGGATEITRVVGRLLDDGGELVTVLHREDLPDEGMAEVTAEILRDHPDAEVHGVRVPGLPALAQVGVE